MKSQHTVKKGETIEFENLGEVQDWAEKHEYKEDEFACVSSDPFIYEKVK